MVLSKAGALIGCYVAHVPMTAESRLCIALLARYHGGCDGVAPSSPCAHEKTPPEGGEGGVLWKSPLGKTEGGVKPWRFACNGACPSRRWGLSMGAPEFVGRAGLSAEGGASADVMRP